MKKSARRIFTINLKEFLIIFIIALLRNTLKISIHLGI
jgi:hypothetical protein